MNVYSKKVRAILKNPLNEGVISDPDGYGQYKDFVHGNIVEIFLRVKDGRIKSIKFRTLGCLAAVASSVMATILVKGKTVEDAGKISKKDILGELGGLPLVKEHCGDLVVMGLRAAINDYYGKS